MSENSLLLSRADSAVMSRDYALAARLYATLLKEKPDDKDLLKRLGDVYIKSGDDKKALGIYERLLSIEPQNSDTMLALGGIYRRVKMYDKSVAVLNKALESGAKEVQVYYNLGFTYKFQEKFEEAIDCFETVVTLNPGDVLAYIHMGSIYQQKKEYDAAIQAYQMGLKVDPNHPILHFNLAKTYDESGNDEAAVREYEAALRYKPGWKEAYVGYSRMLFKSGRIKEAENLAEQALKLNDDSARLQSLMGDIYMAEDYYEGAEEKYNKSLKADPNRLQDLLGLARSLEAQGKNAEAVEAIQKAKELAPDSDDVSRNSAAINLSAKKLAAANKEIKALIEKDGDDVQNLDLAGQYYICADDEKSAQDCYKKIENFDPLYKAHLSNASKRYKQKGDLKKAQACIKKFLSESPLKNSRAYVALAQIEEGLGNLSEALSAYNKALASGGENKIAKKSSERLARSIGKKDIEEVQAPAESLDLNEGFDDIDDIQIDMGGEEISDDDFDSREEKGGEEVSLEDDFDLDAFGKSPLLAEEEESDFSSIAGMAESEEALDEKAGDMGLLEEGYGLKEKIEEEEIPENIPLEPPVQENLLPEAEEENAVQEEPEAEENAAAFVSPDLEAQKKALEDEYQKKMKSLEEANKELEEKMALIDESAQKAGDAAEKAWYAAQMAADNAQAMEQSLASESETEDEPDLEPEPEPEPEPQGFGSAAEKAAAMIPAIENILRQERSQRDFSSEIKMFKALRGLSDSLPEEERRGFLQSRTRVSLDYLISKLEGRPGLLKTSAALRKSGELLDFVQEEDVNTDYSLDELAKIVVTDMKALSGFLEEDDLVIALNNLADNFLNGQE